MFIGLIHYITSCFYLVYLTWHVRRRKKIKDYEKNSGLHSCDSPYKSIEKQGDEYSPDIADTLRSLKVEIRSWRVDNDRIIQSREILSRAQEKKGEVNAMIL